MLRPLRKIFLNRLAGFTLVELMIVVVGGGLLSVMAGVYWNKFTSKMKVSNGVKELRSAILSVKSDAVTRRRYSGIQIDFAQRRYMVFVDSSATSSTTRNCRWDAGETMLKNWSSLSSKIQFSQIASSISPEPPIRDCGTAATSATQVQTGVYSVVFRPDGSSCATLSVKAGSLEVPSDTFRLTVLPATGLVQVEP
ncbi:MAG: hypothetical protein AAB214_10025 [Fibrobacterota bacterium]